MGDGFQGHNGNLVGRGDVRRGLYAGERRGRGGARTGHPERAHLSGGVGLVSWRHLNLFQHEAYLHARVPLLACEACRSRFGTKTVRSGPTPCICTTVVPSVHM